MAYKDIVKPWFETGDYPTQAQFYQKFDYLRWKDEAIAMDEVTGLPEAINALQVPVTEVVSDGSDIQYTIPVGYILEKVVVIPQAPCQPSLQYASGSPGDIIEAKADPTLVDVWHMDIVAHSVPVYVMLVDLPAAGKAYFIKRKLF